MYLLLLNLILNIYVSHMTLAESPNLKLYKYSDCVIKWNPLPRCHCATRCELHNNGQAYPVLSSNVTCSIVYGRFYNLDRGYYCMCRDLPSVSFGKTI